MNPQSDGADPVAGAAAESALRSRRRRWAVVGLIGFLVVVLGAGVALRTWVPERWLPWDTAAFPAVDTSRLAPEQARVVDLLRGEHEAQRPGTFYSEGVEEDWCADFVSWIMREADRPFENPHSGHWRIPGVYTLTEFYESRDRFERVGGYVPRVGDVVLYDSVSGFGQHTNVVVAVDGDSVTTVGGNEMGRIRVHDLAWRTDPGVVGFGRLDAPAP